MGIDFAFRKIDSGNLHLARDFISSQPLSYPNYHSWAEKSLDELSSGIKSGILAFSNGEVVGNVIHQQHKQIPSLWELKQIRVNPFLRGRLFAGFMLRQAELEMGGDAIIVDARKEQRNIIGFLESQGYISVKESQLYDENTDVIMIKPKKLESYTLLN